jgi:hypothetical protein
VAVKKGVLRYEGEGCRAKPAAASGMVMEAVLALVLSGPAIGDLRRRREDRSNNRTRRVRRGLSALSEKGEPSDERYGEKPEHRRAAVSLLHRRRVQYGSQFWISVASGH